MYIDSQEVFAAAQAVTAIGDTASTNVLDTGAAQDEGIGEEFWITAKVNTTVTSGGAPTVAAVVQSSPDNATWTDLEIGAPVALAALTAKTELFKQRISPNAQRYLRVVWRVGTAVLTAGAFDAYLTKDVQAYKFYPSGFSVS